MAKELKVNLIMVSFDDNGNRIETNWEDVQEPDRERIRQSVTDSFMSAAGYIRTGEEICKGRNQVAGSG